MWDVESNLSELQLCVCVHDFCLSMHPASDYILYRWHHCGGTVSHIRYYSRTKATEYSILQSSVATIPDVVILDRATNKAVCVFEVSVFTLF